MQTEILGLAPVLFLAAFAVSMFAGFVKGAVGFAMPLIMISGLSMFLPAPVALAALIFSTVLMNVAQAFRQGTAAALQTVKDYRVLIGTLVVFIILSAPLVPILPESVLFLILGTAILAFSVSQLLGKPLKLSDRHRTRAELLMGAVAGFFGGISGVWGPPVVSFLLSFHVDKKESHRVQGVIFLVGGVILLVSHIGSGVLNAQTAPLSAALLVPTGLGMWLGFRVHDRLDAQKFRRVTLLVLTLAALNLLRKAVLG